MEKLIIDFCSFIAQEIKLEEKEGDDI